MAKVKAKPASAGARIKRQGRSLVWVTLDAEQKQTLRTAAALDGVPMSQFLVAHGLAAAEKVVAEFRRKKSP